MTLPRARSLLAGLFAFSILIGGGAILQNDGGVFVPRAFSQSNPAQIQQKAKLAQSQIMARAQSGQPVSSYLEQMQAAKKRFDAGDMAGGEAILDGVLASLSSDAAPAAAAPGPQADSADVTNQFRNPQPVEIRGYNSELGAMEPFVTRDGRFLLFNNAADAFGAGKANPDLHYARRIDDRTFEYVGPIAGANSDAMDGAASMDKNNNLFFTSARQYDRDLQTLFMARFDNGHASGLQFIPGDVSKRQRGVINMDGEISADGQTLYFSDNAWDTTNNVPATSTLVIARKNGGEFRRDPRSDEIMRNINTGDMVYAPATSADELELYFTKIKFQMVAGRLAGAETSMFMSTRASRSDSFGHPKRIAAITGFVEGPSISSDGRHLYYHRKDGKTYRLYVVERSAATVSGGR